MINGKDPRELQSAPEIISDLAHHLVAGRQDPSDPDAAIEYLLGLELYRPSIVCRHLDAALDGAGQIYIAMEMSRREVA